MAELRPISYELDEMLVSSLIMSDTFKSLYHNTHNKVKGNLQVKLYNQVCELIRFQIFDELYYR